MQFWNSLAFLMIQRMLAIWSLVPLPFLKPAWTSGCSWFMNCWSLAWRILSITLLACPLKKPKTIQILDISIYPLQIRSVTQSCPTLCDPMNRSTPGLPIHKYIYSNVMVSKLYIFFISFTRTKNKVLWFITIISDFIKEHGLYS